MQEEHNLQYSHTKVMQEELVNYASGSFQKNKELYSSNVANQWK